MVGNGPKNKIDEDVELKPDFCFSFVLMHAVLIDNMDIKKFLKSVFSRITSRQETKDFIMRFSSSYDSHACNSTTRTLQKLINFKSGEIVPLTSTEFFIQFQSRSLAAISAAHQQACPKCLKLVQSIMTGGQRNPITASTFLKELILTKSTHLYVFLRGIGENQ